MYISPNTVSPLRKGSRVSLGYGFAFVQSPPIVLQQMAAITFLP